jgi:hypothetical protein
MNSFETFDVTARKVHQAACVLLLAVAYVVGRPAAPWIVGLVAVVLGGGRFWWPLDVFRQLTWRVLEPAGILTRREVQEDHSTRRVARVLGGLLLVVAAVLIATRLDLAWLLVLAIGVMIALDAAFDVCVLCAVTHQVRSRTQEGASRL